MSEYLPKEIRDQLAAAQRHVKRKRATRSVHVGGEAFAILEMTNDGFSLLADEAPRLRGLVDIYEGAQHIYQALIVASSEEGDLMRYDFKRNTATTRTAPVDFVRPDAHAAGLLSKA